MYSTLYGCQCYNLSFPVIRYDKMRTHKGKLRMTQRFIETATKIQSVKRLLTQNGRGFIPASTEISLLHYTENSIEAHILLSTQEQCFGLDKVSKVSLSSNKVCRENTVPLQQKSLPHFIGRHLLCVQLIINLKSNISTSLNRYSAKIRRELARPSQDMTALQPNRFLSRILCIGYM